MEKDHENSSISVLRSASSFKHEDTYAAVAASVSNGRATVTIPRSPRKRIIKTVIIPNLTSSDDDDFSAQRGAMIIINPIDTITQVRVCP